MVKPNAGLVSKRLLLQIVGVLKGAQRLLNQDYASHGGQQIHLSAGWLSSKNNSHYSSVEINSLPLNTTKSTAKPALISMFFHDYPLQISISYARWTYASYALVVCPNSRGI